MIYRFYNLAKADVFFGFYIMNRRSKSALFIVRVDLASGRDLHLAAERAELSDFEFYCIFERIGARAEWSQARHLGHVTLGYVR